MQIKVIDDASVANSPADDMIRTEGTKKGIEMLRKAHARLRQ